MPKVLGTDSGGQGAGNKVLATLELSPKAGGI